MDIEEIKKFAEAALDFGVARLRETGSVMPMAQLLRTDGEVEFIGIDGPLMNDQRSKSKVAEMIRERVASQQVEAVVILSDIFHAEITVQNQKIRAALGLTVEQAHDLGLCQKREAVMVSIDSPIFKQIVKQNYRRVGDHIELEDREAFDTTMPGITQWQGRFLDFFPRSRSTAGGVQ